MIIIKYQISYQYSIVKKTQMYSAKSPTTVGPASVSWARDLARATPVTWAGQLSSPQQQLQQLQRRHAPATAVSALSSMF